LWYCIKERYGKAKRGVNKYMDPSLNFMHSAWDEVEEYEKDD
jgi:hypothetical protein